MKVRNLVLGLMLATNVLTAQGDVFTTAATTDAITTANTVMLTSANNARSSEKTIANAVTSNMMNSQNSVIVECPLKTVQIKKDGEWFGSMRPSLKETIEDSRCQYNKKAMEELNGAHYKFGKVKGIFDVHQEQHVMIELVQVNE